MRITRGARIWSSALFSSAACSFFMSAGQDGCRLQTPTILPCCERHTHSEVTNMAKEIATLKVEKVGRPATPMADGLH